MAVGTLAAVAELDVVVVAYGSRDTLRACVEALVGVGGVRVIVVDNASPDESLETVADLDLETVRLDRNLGFGAGCNAGWRQGDAPAVLFLNPDARLDEAAVRQLLAAFDDERVGVVGPRIVGDDGQLDFSQRRFPRLRSTFAQALFLHRLLPSAAWVDEVVRDPAAYAEAHDVEWLSGACLLVRRSLLERLGGFDERFFMYCEDKDLCRRAWNSGAVVRYEPAAVVEHEGGVSAPRAGLLPVLAASRVRYAKKHSGRVVALGERLGIVVGALTHLALTRKGRAVRAGHARAFVRAFRA